jgi:hypothetical protein
VAFTFIAKYIMPTREGNIRSTGQEPLSYNQAAEMLSKKLGKKIFYIDIPQEDTRKGMKSCYGELIY